MKAEKSQSDFRPQSPAVISEKWPPETRSGKRQHKQKQKAETNLFMETEGRVSQPHFHKPLFFFFILLYLRTVSPVQQFKNNRHTTERRGEKTPTL